MRPFVDNSRLIDPILRRLEDELPGASLPSHFKKVFAACNIPLERATVSYLSAKSDIKDLTRRETEILQWMAEGLQNKQIAEKTFISVNTVKTHVQSILGKLGGQTRSQAIFKAKKFGILNQD